MKIDWNGSLTFENLDVYVVWHFFLIFLNYHLIVRK